MHQTSIAVSDSGFGSTRLEGGKVVVRREEEGVVPHGRAGGAAGRPHVPGGVRAATSGTGRSHV